MSGKIQFWGQMSILKIRSHMRNMQWKPTLLSNHAVEWDFLVIFFYPAHLICWHISHSFNLFIKADSDTNNWQAGLRIRAQIDRILIRRIWYGSGLIFFLQICSNIGCWKMNNIYIYIFEELWPFFLKLSLILLLE